MKEILVTTPSAELLIRDVTQLVSIQVNKIIVPKSIHEVQEIVKNYQGKICIGGGRFSMGGQTALEDALHIDMRAMNQIVDFNKAQKTISVQAGCIWREIQEVVDKENLAIKIMQTYANFTVGGSLSVNSHGRYIGLGPLVLSVISIKIVLADGTLVEATPTTHRDLFYGAIGGYGGLGVIVEVTLSLTDNIKVSRHSIVLKVSDYYDFFKNNIKRESHAIFHNADLYPPHYKKVRAVTWFESYEPVTHHQRLIPKNHSYPLQKYFIWAVSSTLTGKWRRQLYIDPLFYFFKKVVYRNYEASYDVAELEPRSRVKSTYVLQEYFVPVNQLETFIKKISLILNRHHVNVLNISIRHAEKDPGTLLAWATTEVFALVLYYKEKTTDLDKNVVPIWTRELIDAALSCQGRYYLPYQLHATFGQFCKAYEHYQEFFALKAKLDPQYKFSNKLWDKYYMNKNKTPESINDKSEFKKIFMNTEYRDKFFLFLQNVFNVMPENAFHLLIYQQTQKHETDKEIYQAVQSQISSIKPILNDLRYAIPALIKQKKELTKQTSQLISQDMLIDGYVEIGSNGRYISDLKHHFKISNIYYVYDAAQTFSPIDIIERGSLIKYGTFIPFNNYDPISEQAIKSSSIDLVTSYIGLHHCPKEKLDDFIRSLYRILKPGGAFILRDHHVNSDIMFAFVSLAHTVFNAGLGVSWEENEKELRLFNSIEHWISYLEKFGFKSEGEHLLQPYDPSLNTLIKFVKK
ncbi:MAG: FAD-binding protein [Proteobacteria bacterium]|nr:FAD-binding protein [Pseudomonadota bacterium]